MALLTWHLTPAKNLDGVHKAAEMLGYKPYSASSMRNSRVALPV
ncbi:hypothetical protein [Salmonella enterica]